MPVSLNSFSINSSLRRIELLSMNPFVQKENGAQKTTQTLVEPKTPDNPFFKVVCRVPQENIQRAEDAIRRMVIALEKKPNLPPSTRDVKGFNSAIDELRKCLPQGSQVELNLQPKFGESVSGADLTGIDFRNCNLSIKQGWTTGFRKVNLTRVLFSKASIGEAIYFENSNLTEANFDEAKLKNVRFMPMVQFGPNFDGPDVTLTAGPTLRRASFIKADLQGACFNNGDLGGVDLQGANFQGADIKGTSLERTNLTGASFQNAITGQYSLHKGTRQTSFSKANLTNANLTGIDLNGVNLEGTTLNGIKR